MRNKVLVLLVVVLCLWLTLQGRAAKNKQQRPAEDDSDEQPAKAVPKQQQSSKKKNADANKKWQEIAKGARRKGEQAESRRGEGGRAKN